MPVSALLLKALAVTAELTSTQLSPEAVQVMASDLSEFSEPQVIGALTRCRKELRGRLTIAEIILRLEDGRPGPEEAWAMMPKSEMDSAVLTDEMSVAMGALALLPDEIAARMAFKEMYTAEITRARNDHKPVRWFPSLGFDPSLREGVLRTAVEKGRLTADHANALLPDPMPTGEGLRLIQDVAKKLCSPESNRERIAELRELVRK